MTRPLLVLLPGLLCDETVWSAQAGALSRRADIHVPAYHDERDLGAMAERVLAGIDRATFALAGHSMGGRIAMEVLRRAPRRIERLALLDTGVHALPEGEAGEREKAGRLRLLDLARREGMRAMATEWARGMVHPSRIGGPVFEAILAMFGRRTPAQFAGQIAALLGRADTAPLLPGITCPTLVLTGREDAWAPPAQHEAIAARIPGARLVVVDDCGHMGTMERPEALTAALAEWLGQPR
jgi:pimeloyl-ACP methyl ester carboxylesterase